MIEQSNESVVREIWSRADIPQAVDELRDRIGRSVDEKIKPLVIGLLSAGVGTVASCEGHTDHGERYPWVQILVESEERLVRLLHMFNRDGSAKWKVDRLVDGEAKAIFLCPADTDQSLEKLQADALILGEWLLDIPFTFKETR